MTTQAQTNKQLMADAMGELAKGNSRLFSDLMADDFVWRMMGSGPWGRVYRGKANVSDQLFRPLWSQFADRQTTRPLNILAEGDQVVVECVGAVTLKNGKPYGNRYCLVIHMREGKMRELREYCDTALCDAVLEPLPE